MIKQLQHARNRYLDDGSLRNAILDIKDLLRPWQAMLKQDAAATAASEKWGHAQISCVSEYMTALAAYERELQKLNIKFTDHYSCA